MKMECDYLNGWITKRPQTQKYHRKWWAPDILLGNAEEEEEYLYKEREVVKGGGRSDICVKSRSWWRLGGGGDIWREEVISV